MCTSLVKDTSSKVTYLGVKVDQSKVKKDFLKEIVKNYTLTRPLLKTVENIQTFSEIEWKQKLSTTGTCILRSNCPKKESHEISITW